MFSKLKRLVGNITLEVKNNIVKIEGIPADVIQNDFKKIWGTSKIYANMFNDIDKNSFSFNEYFCIELMYALERMLEDDKIVTNKRTLNKIKTLLLEETWLKNSTLEFPSRMDYSKLKEFHFTPFDYQSSFFTYYDAVAQQYELNGMLLAAAAGSGKTQMSIMTHKLLGNDQVIIVSPNNAIYRVWDSTLKTCMKYCPSIWICKDNRELKGDEEYIVINYEYLGKFLEQINKLKGKKIGVILDESHNFNTHDSLRTSSFVEMCALVKSKDTLWLSGTPIKALSTEAIPLLRTIDRKFNTDTENRFKKIFGVSSERATDILKNRLGITSFKVEKKEMNVLPPIFKEIKVIVPEAEKYTLESISKAMSLFTLERIAFYKNREKDDREFFDKCLKIYQRTIKNKAEYEAFESYKKCLEIVIRSGGDVRSSKEEIIYCNKFENTKILPLLPKELKAEFKSIKSIIKYVRLKIQGECLGQIVGKARINAHVDLCDHIDYVSVLETTTKKTVVFTSFVDVVEKLQTYLPKIGLEPLFVYAKTNNNLTNIIDKFEKDENVNPLVATYASLSTAVPLTMADTMIMVDSPFRDYQLQQTVSRISRVGATTQTYVYTAVLDTKDKPNISTRSFDILKWSQMQVEAITGVQSPFEISDNLEQSNLALEGLEEPLRLPNGQPSFLSW